MLDEDKRCFSCINPYSPLSKMLHLYDEEDKTIYVFLIILNNVLFIALSVRLNFQKRKQKTKSMWPISLLVMLGFLHSVWNVLPFQFNSVIKILVSSKFTEPDWTPDRCRSNFPFRQSGCCGKCRRLSEVTKLKASLSYNLLFLNFFFWELTRFL